MRRSLLVAAGLALVAPLLASIGPAATADDRSADDGAPVTLWAPPTVTAYAYRNRTWTDLGLRVIAEGGPLEIRSHRPSYDDLIETSWISSSGTVELPAGSMDDFSGLKRFLSISIDPRKRGKTIELTRKACLNGYAERVRPDAPARSPYPVGCWYNAYSLGSVQGVQEGWAASLMGGGRALRVGPGRYDVTATINPEYAELLGLSPEEATRTLVLKVLGEDGHGHQHRAAPRVASPTAQPEARAPRGPEGRADEAGPTPDLRSLPAWGLSLSRNFKWLRFSATVWNAGDSPLVVDGFRRENEDIMDAYQYFFDADGNQTGYQEIGALHFDDKDSHQHWHFEDFARYSLLDADKSEAVRSRKEAFCLANTDAIDLTVPGAEWKPENTDLATSCGDPSSLSIREVLAAGWGDTYTQYRAGQSFKIANLPNGTYYVAVLANPDGRLVEQSTDNNLELREIRLSGRPDKRKLWVEQVGLIEEEGYGGTG
ncbi:MAG: lysyl oxidase family protein [Nocardioides sp.]